MPMNEKNESIRIPDKRLAAGCGLFCTAHLPDHVQPVFHI
jgi:hypothetical protein